MIRSILLRITLLILSSISTANLHSQISPEPIQGMLSPNVASIKRFGDIPVSLFTGIPNIEVPLYLLETQSLSLKISLRYHAGGVLVDQRPGWVGLNWNLDAGGVITRKKNYIPDEFNITDPHNNLIGYYHDSRLLNTDNWNKANYLSEQLSKVKNPYDFAPDEFTFYFGDYQGKFYLSHEKDEYGKRKWIVQCDRPVKVEVQNEFLPLPSSIQGVRTGYQFFKGFTIIIENGTRYYFGGGEQSIEYSTPAFYNPSSQWIASSWYLTKITSPNGKIITLNYEKELTKDKKSDTFISQLYESSVSSRGYSQQGGSWINRYTFRHNDFPHEGVQGTIIRPVYLTSITSDNAIITFERSESKELEYTSFDYVPYNLRNDPDYKEQIERDYFPRAYPHAEIYAVYGDIIQRWFCNLKKMKLDNISISNKDGSYKKNISLKYSNSERQRLVLKNVNISNEGNYNFTYYWINRLPPYLSHKTDHWGFLNNTQANYTDIYNFWNYKIPEPIFMKFGMLTKITYPTGGFTEFEYEAHDYSHQVKKERWFGTENVLSNNQGGGLRIKRIKQSDSKDLPAKTVKEYHYISNFEKNMEEKRSSGILNSQFQYYIPDLSIKITGGNIYNFDLFYSSSLLPSSVMSSDPTVSYTEVIEQNADSSYIKYKFSNYGSSDCNDMRYEAAVSFHPFYLSSYVTKSMERGKLLSKESYNNNNELIKKHIFTYENDIIPSKSAVRTIDCSIDRIPGIRSIELFAYPIYTYSKRKVKEEIINYGANTELSNIINYEYNDYKLLRSVTTYNSNGKKHLTTYKYSFDKCPSAPYNEMVDQHILSPIIETTKMKDEKKISAVRSNYYQDIEKTKNLILLKDIETSYGEIDKFTKIISYDLYDKKGNVIQTTDRIGIPITYLWSYNNEYPIAAIQNMNYQQVETSLGGAAEIERISKSNTLLASDLAKIRNIQKDNIQISIATYSPLAGMTSLTSPAGISTYYKYQNDRLDEIIDNKGQNIVDYKYKYTNDSIISGMEPEIEEENFTLRLLNNEYKVLQPNEAYNNKAIVSKINKDIPNFVKWTVTKISGNSSYGETVLDTDYSENDSFTFLPDMETSTVHYIVECTATDLLTGYSRTVKDLFSVVINNSQELYLINNTSPRRLDYAEATIICVRPVTVEFWLEAFPGTLDYTNFDLNDKRIEFNAINIPNPRSERVTLRKGISKIMIYCTRPFDPTTTAAIKLMNVDPKVSSDGFKSSILNNIDATSAWPDDPRYTIWLGEQPKIEW